MGGLARDLEQKLLNVKYELKLLVGINKKKKLTLLDFLMQVYISNVCSRGSTHMLTFLNAIKHILMQIFIFRCLSEEVSRH